MTAASVVLRFSLVMIWGCIICMTHVAPAADLSADDLTRELDAALGNPGDAKKLAGVVERVQQEITEDLHDELWIKSRLGEAIACLGQGRLDECTQVAVETAEAIRRSDFPELYFRLRSVEAAAFLAKGKKAESLKAFEDLLASDNSDVKPIYVTRARINYAATLAANGNSQAAAEEYESVMESAIEAGNELAAIHCGNNLVTLLKDDGELEHAERVIELLSPLLAKKPNFLGTYSVRLHRLEIARLQGSFDEAAEKLQQILAEPSLPELIQASAHRHLALTELELGNIDVALQHVRQSVKLFSK